MDYEHVKIEIDERGIRALHAAVCYTLDQWSGQGEMDQEELLSLKPFLQGAIFEFDFARDMG